MESQPSRGAGIGKAAAFAFGTASLLVQKATQDGHLAAAFRQGIDELGVALKPLPDSIQAQEAGTIFNPTQGEIAADRKESLLWPGHSSPSGIVAGHSSVHGSEQGGPHGDKPARSPSEIIAERGGIHGPEKGHLERLKEERQKDENASGGNDANGQGRGRSLPDEQRDRGRGR